MLLFKFLQALFAAEIIEPAATSVDNGLLFRHIDAADRILHKLIRYRGPGGAVSWRLGEKAGNVFLKGEITKDQDGQEKQEFQGIILSASQETCLRTE